MVYANAITKKAEFSDDNVGESGGCVGAVSRVEYGH